MTVGPVVDDISVPETSSLTVTSRRTQPQLSRRGLRPIPPSVVNLVSPDLRTLGMWGGMCRKVNDDTGTIGLESDVKECRATHRNPFSELKRLERLLVYRLTPTRPSLKSREVMSGGVNVYSFDSKPL